MSAADDKTRTIYLSQFVRDKYTDFRARYKEKLKPGSYHLKSFRVFRDPIKYRQIAFLNCVEGKYWTRSPLILGELATDMGDLIDIYLRKTSNNTIIGFTVAMLSKFGGKGKGLGFVI